MNARRRTAALVLSCAFAAGARAELPPLPEPGEPGSHERYVEALRREEARVATELLGRYERRIAEAPEDRVAAIERCRFLDAAFTDPETESNPREEERAACVEDVESRFATDPDVRVFAIEQRWGDEAVEAGRRFLSDPPRTAGPSHLAAVHAHLARQLAHGAPGDALRDAEQGMALDPSLDLRLLLARERIETGDRAGARAALVERLEETRDRWELEAKGALLADLEAFAAALAAFEEVERRGETPRRKLDHARALAGAGRIEEARALYAGDPGSWPSEKALREHFDFELRNGSAATARAAYDALRARGWETDPLGRARLALLAAHPRAGWRWVDATGLAALAAVGLGIALLPACFILPIHGVGLLRARRTKGTPRSPAPFGLRHAWLASAVLVLAEGLAVLVYPGAVDEGGGDLTTRPEIARFAVLGAVASVVGVLLVVQGKLRGLLAAGRWGWRRTVATGVLLALGLQLLVFAIARASGGSASDAATTEIMRSVQRSFGLSASLVWAALLVPLAEEIVFRGVLLSAFATRVRAGWANVAQASLFGLAHAHPILTPAFFAFGLVAGRATRSSGSLRAALLAHVLNNALACVALAWTN
jgi:membrane protease YdiL (CAAX protease family)